MVNQNKKKLKEQDHRSFLSKTLWKFKSNFLFTDLTLVCGDGEVKVHKAMLANVIKFSGSNLSGEELDCLIVPDVSVRQVEEALEWLYLKLDTKPILKLFYPVKCEAIELGAENALKEDVDEGMADQFDDSDHIDDMMDIKFSTLDENEEIKQEPFELENQKKTMGPDIETKSKQGRGRPKGRTDKTKRKSKISKKSQTFKCDDCDIIFKGRIDYRSHLKELHGQEGANVEAANVITQCPYCDKVLATLYIFQCHVALLHREEAIQYHPEITLKRDCLDCEEKFFNVHDLDKHTKNVHGKRIRKFKCNFCGEELEDKTSLRAHRIALHKEELAQSGFTGFIKNIPCLYCDKKFRANYNLYGHIFNSHREKLSLHPEIKLKYSCKECQESFYGKGNLTNHNALVHGEEFECRFCDMTFKHKPTRNFHVESQHKDTQHMCEICSKAFKTKSAISKHMRRHSDVPYFKFPCSHCSKGAQSEKGLQTHMETNHQGKQYMCAYCASAFTSSTERIMHEKRVHGEKTIPCNQCEKKFALEYQLNNHIKNVHIKKKDKICPICGEEFFDLDTFKCHVNRHSDHRPFPCDTCGKAFHTSRDMKTHMKVHSLPYQCHLCEKSLSAKGLLDDHLRKHAGDKLLCRHTCGKAYLDRRHRDRHEKSCDNNPNRGATWAQLNKSGKCEDGETWKQT
eukprot:GFUD01028339.1.p1 GENE.GFUD01028339.1~~GFUD01028339.1.p1  ORF type:complete len:683 (+),score=146.91 GFUD01028339.1:53-2101(+)